MTTLTLRLDDDLVADLRADAERTGRSVDEVAADRLRRHEPVDILERLRARPGGLSEEEGMQLALHEVRAVREESRNAD